LEKDRPIPPEKVPLFVGRGVSRKRDTKPHLKFYMTRTVFLIYRMMLRRLGFKRPLPNLRPLKAVAVMGLDVAFRELYKTSAL
jgi:hypothetical protein